jgi:hypothetical protein
VRVSRECLNGKDNPFAKISCLEDLGSVETTRWELITMSRWYDIESGPPRPA